MDGRWKRVLAGAALAGLVGCTTTSPSNLLTQATPPSPPGKNTIVVPEPTDDGAKKEGPISANTKLVYANMCVDVVAKDPNKPAADRDRILTQSRQIYQEVLAADPKNVDALMGLGELYQVTGEQDRMNEVMNRATKQNPANAKVWAWVAIKQGQAKNWNAAADSYARAVKFDPDNRMYRIQLGFTLARTSRYDEGYEWLSRSMREAEARYNLAMMMIHNGEPERAKMELERCLRADPNFGVAGEKLAALHNGHQPSKDGSDVQPVGFEVLEPVLLNPGR